MSCPSHDELFRLLDGESPAEWDGHISGCHVCQAFLDQAADDRELRSWHAAVQNYEGADSEISSLLVRLRSGGTINALPDFRSMLAEPARPGDLGVLGPYWIEAVLGHGGMGVVFRAFDPKLQRTVAIKVLRPATDDAMSRLRIVREAQALAQLKHPNIVQIHSIAETMAGLPYLVMEFVPGQSLAEYQRDRGRLPPREAAELVAEVADGLQFAHDAGLVHRDVKPGNILLQWSAGATDMTSIIAKLTDFGLARDADATVTASGILAGTPAYISPEQVRAPATIDARADVYAMGVTLYECLTGDVPFRGSTAMVLRQILDDEPRPPRRLNEAVPRDLQVICLKAMTKERGQRYASAAEFAADLRRYLAGEPILARPAGLTEKTWRWCRRRPLPAALGAALLIATTMGIAGVLWQWRVAVARATEAEENLRDAAAAVDQFLTRVSQDQLIDSPGFEPLRKQLLEDALAFYQRLLTKPSAGPALQVETAKAAERAASLVALLRPGEEAIAAWDRAIALWEQCPAEPSQRDRQLRSRLNRAVALTKANRFEESLAEFQAMLPELKNRVERNPGRIDYQRELVSASAAIANNHSHAGRREAAQLAFIDAESAFERLLQLNPDSVEDLRRLAFCFDAHGMVLPAGDGLPKYDRARAVQERVVELTKRIPADLHRLGRIHHHRGVALDELGRKDEARAAMADACQILDGLSRGSPAVLDYRKSLASALHWLGAAQADAKVPGAADTLARARSEYEQLRTHEPHPFAIDDSLRSIKAYQDKVRLETR